MILIFLGYDHSFEVKIVETHGSTFLSPVLRLFMTPLTLKIQATMFRNGWTCFTKFAGHGFRQGLRTHNG